jgi:alkyl sulfatase BDS1-like metallo-beta-lactamase superfamily hydrolase
MTAKPYVFTAGRNFKLRALTIHLLTPSATDATKLGIAEFSKSLPLGDKQDYADAARGFLGSAEERQIKNAAGKVVYDLDAYVAQAYSIR